ncbi:enoyl-CoA hydratase-related protein [Yinghuangia sp. YIM S09857]|uniref:enoyl-CoA hydratase-related protein n=1 Tax=Yinghuangia sp. YIM S09857 TaxID=3436929 RepID=UPI003F53B56E
MVTLTMNRPHRRNALVPDMLVRFADAWDMVDADDSVRCVILTGAGEDAYCAGGDLSDGWMSGEVTDEARLIQQRLKDDPGIVARGLLLNHWCRKPIIAAVNGQCMGGGCEMLQQTDIRIAEEHATFAVPEVRRGLIAGAGSTMRLKRQIPYAVAMDMLLTGRVLSADEALRWGLVSHLVPRGEALAKAREIAAVICANGPLAVNASKASSVETGWLPEAEARPIESSHVGPVTRSRDAREGMRAFAEKRPARFEGR